jgi:hypothetical protein
MFDYDPSATQSDLETMATLAAGIAQYCRDVLTYRPSDSGSELLETIDHNRECFEKITRGLAVLNQSAANAGLA